MSTQTTVDQKRETARRLNRFIYRLAKHWLLIVNVFMGILITLPWLAAVFMYLGWETPGRAIHVGYMALCHQFPQRSYFLFGPQGMYTLDEVAQVWEEVNNPLTLRRFIGTPEMGWKIAWSDRMVSMYGSIFLFGVLYHFVRRRLKPLPFWGFVLFLVPMGIDGITHVISDLYGLTNGFRYHNEWLAQLTNYAFDPLFYSGNGFWSFNWWMRLISGLLFGMGLVWFAYPYLESGFKQTMREIEAKFRNAGVELEA